MPDRPAVTVAVEDHGAQRRLRLDGPWGSGKTSLLELVRRRLPSRGFRVVHFNAWHHQREEHLLASLLKTIQTESLPHWWAEPISFVIFRARLLKLRLFGRRSRFAGRFGLFATLILAAVLVYLWLPLEIVQAPRFGAGMVGAGALGALLSISQPFHAKARDALLLTLVALHVERFRSVDIEEDRSIPVSYPVRRIRVVSQHPEGSSKLEEAGPNESVLRILDPNAFWTNRFLVIAVKP